MAKIPLERTIGATYRFAFTNILSVLGVIWLPYLILAGCVGAFVCYVILPDLKGFDFNPHAGAAQMQVQGMRLAIDILRFVWPIQLLGIVLYSMATVGVMRKALGLHPGPIFAYFSLDAPVWRMIGARILTVLIILAVAALTAGAGLLLVVAAQHFLPAAATFITVCCVGIGVCWIIYMVVRLFFFLPAVVVAENRIGLGRSWQLGGGNFWRIIALVLATVVAPAIVASIVSRVIFMQSFFDMAIHIQQMAAAHKQFTPHDVLALVLAQIRQLWPFLAAYYIVYFTIMAGLTNGVVASAYKAVTASEVAA